MGIALQRFKEKAPKTAIVIKQKRWPLLWQFVEKGILLEVDYFITEQILSSKKNYSVEVACLVSVIVAVSRLGSLCLKIDEKEIEPPLNEWVQDSSLIPQLQELLLQGLSQLDKEFFLLHKALCKAGNRIYISANFSLESRFLKDVSRLVKDNSDVWEAPLILGLNEEQKKAAELCLSHHISLLTGGPGTGKTYTAAQIVKGFIEKKGEGARIIVAAPTGKASAHLESSIRKVIGNSPGNIRSTTLHSLLQIRLFGAASTTPLVADLIIIDECSMIDAKIFSHFFSLLQKGTKVLLMGDKDQLPAVESGSFFADLVDASAQGFAIPCAELSRSMRSDEKGILELSDAIKKGDKEKAALHLQDKRVDLELKPSAIFAYANGFFEGPSEKRPDPISLLKKGNDLILLCPLRQGPCGVDSINAFFVENLTRKDKWLASPILITRTDYTLGLYNGDTGILISKGEDKTAYFLDKEGNVSSFAASLLPSFEYAYCLSIHKAQGSEYPNVLLLLPSSSENFGKEMLYTAVTRVKNDLKIAGSFETISACLQKDSRKISGLCERLKMSEEVN
jgi:exodeoxyribonuclease V alpha subunit